MDNEIAAIDEISKMTSQSEKSKITGLGARLRKARESMQLTQKEAAARLYLNPKIVEVIENEAFFEGPPITFMRGYLRSYARLLNFPESDINAAIDELELTATPTTPTAPLLQPSPIYRGDKYIRWITYLIVATLISLVIVWWSSHSKYVIADVPSTNQTPVTTITNQDTLVETPTTTVPTENTSVIAPQPTEPMTQTITTPATISETPVKTDPVVTKTIPAAPIKTETTTSVTQPKPPVAQDQQPAPAVTNTAPVVTSVPAAPVQPTAAPEATQTAAAPTTVDNTAATTPPADTQNTQAQTTANLTAGASDPLTATTAPEATAVKEKPKHSRKHRRHQYRPIENMEIPEPE